MMSIVTSSYAQALAWSLVHFLWQGTLIGLLAFAGLRFARLSVNARHALGVATLATMMAAPVATFGWLASAYAPSESSSRGAIGKSPAEESESASAAGRARGGGAPRAVNIDGSVSASAPVAPNAIALAGQNTALTLVLWLWLAGVVCLSARLMGGWIVARRLAHRAIGPVSPEVHALARRLAGRLALERVVQVFESTAIAVPVMIGWVKPVILLPAAAMSGLTPDQIEALLAHELAHVRRHDYLINLLQCAVETLLFYHPAVWWVSRQVREAREHCCDDLAISVCGDRVAYAGALADLAAMTTPRLVLAASDGSLAARVRRILGQPGEVHRAPVGWAPVALTLLLCGALVPLLAHSGETSNFKLHTSKSGVPPRVDTVTSPRQSAGEPGSSIDREREEVAAKVKTPAEVQGSMLEAQTGSSPDCSAEQLKRQVEDYEKMLAELQQLLDQTVRGKVAQAASAASDEEQAAKSKAFAERIANLETQRIQIETRGGPELTAVNGILEEEEKLKEALEVAQHALYTSQLRQLETEKLRQAMLERSAKAREDGLQADQARAAKLDLAREELTRKAEAMRQEAAMKLDQASGEAAATEAERDRQTLELVMQSLVQKLAQAREGLGEASQRLSENHPEVVKLRETVQFLESQVAEAKTRTLARATSALATYVLEQDDVVRLEVRGSTGRLTLPDLTIAADGTITLPSAGKAKVGGLAVNQAEQDLRALLTSKSLLPEKAAVTSVTLVVVRSNRK